MKAKTPHTSTNSPSPPLPAPTAGKPVAVLGGGVCGLYAALDLARRDIPVTVLELHADPGGLARGNKRGNNFYDLGVHMLHAFDKEVFQTVKDAMGEERIEVPLNAQIRWAGSFYRYPLQFQDMLLGMHKFTLLRCVLGLFSAELLNRLEPREPENAEDALVQLYGWPLYEFFFEEFTWRYWGIHPRGISPLFVTSKMPRLTAADAIKRALSYIGFKEKPDATVESALREETLHYSRTGADIMPRRLAAEVTRLGGLVQLGARVTALETSGRLANTVHYTTSDGTAHTLPCTAVINTLPLPEFTRALTPAPPGPVLESTRHLRFKAIAIYGLLVAKEKALDALYVYYRDRVFHRVGEPKNAGLITDPPDHTVLIVEMTCEPNDAKWTAHPDFLAQVYADLEAEGVCTPDQIVEHHVLTNTHGYPVYARGFEPHLDRVNSHLAPISNLRSVGRQGAFCYPAMHNAMRQGADAAQELFPSSTNQP